MEEVASCFHIFVTGQIEYAAFPMGPNASEVFCRFEIFAGKDWEHVSGLKNGISQSSVAKRGCKEITLNMPIEFVYKSTNPYGWPKLVFCVYGKNFWGAETSLGYALIHVPIFGYKRKIKTPILIPRCSNLLAELSTWITGKNPELKNPEVIAEGIKTKGLQVESYGELVLSLQTMSRGSNRMGYDSGKIQ
ncbi:B9 domain-containing protein 1 [Condylostylus longicornis]|uniref:B9 domain-containing protein 1 n=1 Tax=Condylostylus longicornis TaxID=2530218 RepID=UPI00244E4FA1|nr:B9 domain-containing protein 1 [Condylostylus longicornis]